MIQSVDADKLAAIATLLTEFCWSIDNGHGDRVAALFTPDGRVDAPHFNLGGRAEIDGWFAGRSRMKLSRHCWSNLRVTALGDDRYRAETNLITVSGAFPAPQQGGKIAFTSSTDEIMIKDGATLFVSRTLEVAFDLALDAAVADAATAA